jgi:hypothetical protein
MINGKSHHQMFAVPQFLPCFVRRIHSRTRSCAKEIAFHRLGSAVRANTILISKSSDVILNAHSYLPELYVMLLPTTTPINITPSSTHTSYSVTHRWMTFACFDSEFLRLIIFQHVWQKRKVWSYIESLSVHCQSRLLIRFVPTKDVSSALTTVEIQAIIVIHVKIASTIPRLILE